jgi:3-isopropylmalate/(R)-2-methylmalate dehydratase small subunit
MEPFTSHTGILASLNRANVDTDAIIPKQFLKSIKRTGYGPNAFFDWRYKADGTPNPDFELNQPRFAGRSILVTRHNFGCGSSREHAVWALCQDGYRVIIAPWRAHRGERQPAFADIFRTNAVKNGLLTIALTEAEVDTLLAGIQSQAGLTATVDLAAQTVVVHTAKPQHFNFEIEPASKNQLLQGLDDIDLTLQYAPAIARFEEKHETWRG